MRRGCALITAAWLLAAACGPGSAVTGSPATRSVEQAAAALGGLDRLRTLKSIVMEGAGTSRNLGQDLTPEATAQSFTITGYRRILSFSANALRVEQTRTPTFPYFQGPDAQTQIMGVDGGFGYNISPLGVAVRVSEIVTRQRRIDMLHYPVAVVRAALEPGAQVTASRGEGGEVVVDVTTASGDVVSLGIDASTHLPRRVSSPSYDPNLGDVTIETQFSDYRDVNGIQLPAHLVTKTDRFVTADLTLGTIEVDGITGDMAAPEDAVSSRPAPSTPQPVLDDMEVAPGVWLIAGQSHHSAVIELPDQLLLIEAPQHEARTLAVIRRARELRAGKPLTRVVNTHHHFDHSAGLRAAVAEGLTVVTQAGNEAFVRELVARPHARNPDALARQPQALTLETVTDSHDFSGRVQLFHVAGNPHSSTMLMAYVPEHRLLIEVDAFTPNALPVFAANLLENIRRRGLVVDRIVPLHGTVVGFDELIKVVQR